MSMSRALCSQVHPSINNLNLNLNLNLGPGPVPCALWPACCALWPCPLYPMPRPHGGRRP